MAELGNPEVRGELLNECLVDNGRLIGTRYRNATSVTTRTVDRDEFLDLGSRLLLGAERVDFSARYPYPQFRRSDGTIIGIRYSLGHDVTIDILEGDEVLVPSKTKIHFQ